MSKPVLEIQCFSSKDIVNSVHMNSILISLEKLKSSKTAIGAKRKRMKRKLNKNIQ